MNVGLARPAAELREVIGDGIGELDGHGIIDDGVGMAGLGGPAVQGQQCGFRNAGQGAGRGPFGDLLAVCVFHLDNATGGCGVDNSPWSWDPLWWVLVERHGFVQEDCH